MRKFLFLPLAFLLAACTENSSRPADEKPKVDTTSTQVEESFQAVEPISEQMLLSKANVKSRKIHDDIVGSVWTHDYFDEEGILRSQDERGAFGMIYIRYVYTADMQIDSIIRETDEGLVLTKNHVYEDGKLHWVITDFAEEGRSSDTLKYFYDDKGRLIKRLEPDWEYDFFYDNKGLRTTMDMISITKGVPDGLKVKEFYVNDERGWKIEMRNSRYDKDPAHSWEYDDEGRVMAEVLRTFGNYKHEIEYTYNEHGLVEKKSRIRTLWAENPRLRDTTYFESVYEYEYFEE